MFRIICLVTTILLILPLAGRANVGPLNDEQIELVQQALKQASKKHFASAIDIAAKTNSQLVQDLIYWRWYQSGTKNYTYKEAISFAKRYPHWPQSDRIATWSEYVLEKKTPHYLLLQYFAHEDPKTSYAKELLLEALANLEPSSPQIQARMKRLVRQVWKDSNMKRKQELAFLSAYKQFLSHDDHVARIDRLLWDKRATAAKRLFNLVQEKYQLTFNARILLMRDNPAASSAIKRMPTNMLNDPGFLYERVSWHMRRQRYQSAFEHLKDVATTQPYQEKWWQIKKRLVREFLPLKQHKQAFTLSSGSGNLPDTPEFAESSWLAGWLALRYLNDPTQAYEHFYRMFQHVRFPISRARAAYWAGRAASANGNKHIANNWYTIASHFPTTFYGQLAYIERFGDEPPIIPHFPIPTAEDQRVFRQDEMATLAKILIDAGHPKTAKQFIKAAINHSETEGHAALISLIGNHAKNKALSVYAAKQAEQKGLIFTESGFPFLSKMPNSQVGDSLILGIIRQESRFDPKAKSSAHALGLMQLLPSTAKRMARHKRLRYTYGKLRADPYFNVTLGAYYIDRLYKRFDNSYVLSIASYNAGPTNVRRWIKENGDPRQMNDLYDILDWIENIPFKETRNYVQRVLENKQFYQYVMNQQGLTLAADVTSSTIFD